MLHLLSGFESQAASIVDLPDQNPHTSRILPALVIVAVVTATLGVIPKNSPFMGEDGRLSTSKTVALLWSVFIVWVFTAMTLISLTKSGIPLSKVQDALSELPSNEYLLLLGGPFAALVSAKGIVRSRIADGTLQKTKGDSKIHLSDLVSKDSGQTSLTDLQFTLFNLVAIFWVVATFVKHPMTGLPPIPSGLAGLTSVSALTYIGNKAIQQATPRIAGITPSSARIGDLVTISGTNLLPDHPDAPSKVFITIDSLSVEPETDPLATASAIRVKVPAGVTPGQAVDVRVTSDDTTDGIGSATAKLHVVPDQIKLAGMTPLRVKIGGRLILVGQYFLDPLLPADAPPTIHIGSTEVQPEEGASNTQLSVIVQGDTLANDLDGTGIVNVKVERPGLVSNEIRLHVTEG